MSLGLRLRAQLPNPAETAESFFSRIENWLRNRCMEMWPTTRQEITESISTLFCSIHPAAEDFELALVGPTELVVSANTSTAGPGYHVFLTSLLKELASELEASWENPGDDSDEFSDETGYFFSGDEALLRSEMTRWLSELAGTFFDGTFEPDDLPIALCMPLNPHFEWDAAALTALGPRDLEWLKRTSQDGERGMDFWAWPSPGFTADYYLRRALVRMWSEARWRSPVSESGSRILREVADCLKRAHELDPTLDFPWSEWKQVLDLLGEDRPELSLVASKSVETPAIGYRRKNVKVTLPGGWQITVPGSFGDFEPDQEGDYCALNPPEEIWFTAYHRSGTQAESFQVARKRMKKERADFRTDREDYSAQASVTAGKNKSAEPYFVLRSSNLAPNARSVCTIVFPHPDRRDWAVETWRSLEPPRPSAP